MNGPPVSFWLVSYTTPVRFVQENTLQSYLGKNAYNFWPASPYMLSVKFLSRKCSMKPDLIKASAKYIEKLTFIWSSCLFIFYWAIFLSIYSIDSKVFR